MSTGKIVLDLTMSLDGFIAGANISAEHPLGEGGPRLHHWMFENKNARDAAVLEETVQSSGAVITGARTYYDAIDEAWGGVSPFAVKAFVVSHRQPSKRVSGFTYVSDLESAIVQARAAAGARNVWLMGGADIAQQCLKSLVVDELQIHIAHVLLTAGTRLFDHIGNSQIELEKIRLVESDVVTHLRFRVIK